MCDDIAALAPTYLESEQVVAEIRDILFIQNLIDT